MYKATPIPNAGSVQEVLDYISRELLEIELAFAKVQNGELAYTRHVEPSKPRTGMIVLADGSDWNPGSGQGAYCFYAGAWHFLG